ncbi:cytochrome b/b6 domain-containing protein [Magnetococcus sp. PR-3]|uniref:cytochrome b/b6 domain-containing protein n=1 Tax=Magnetococcus sp. PR-3 TaxID=3120355 RepID=UPI002FCE0578
MMTPQPITIWDLPTRLFHWLLVLLIVGSVYTVKTTQMTLHAQFGYAILTLVLWRVGWGVWGSATSRFSHFVKGPGAVFAYLRTLLAGQPAHHVGHNPAGALMIVALLALLLVQGVGGLFASENTFLFFDGPLVHWVGAEWSETITFWHKGAFNLLIALVAIHVLVNLLYLWLFKHNLILPMVTGQGAGQAGDPALYIAPQQRALLTLLLVMALVGSLLLL